MSRLTVAVEPERVQIPSGSVPLDLESRVWIEGLRATGAEHSRALERLHDLLLRAAYSEAQRRQHLYPEIDGAELDDLCRQPRRRSGRGHPKARRLPRRQPIHDLGVRVRNLRGLDEAPKTRLAWRRYPTADDDDTWDRLAIGATAAQAHIESTEFLRALRRAVSEELPPRQREVFIAVALKDVQMDVVAEQLQSTRGAVYKVPTTHERSSGYASSAKGISNGGKGHERRRSAHATARYPGKDAGCEGARRCSPSTSKAS